ncbi:glycoside hydrolase family 88 protein [Lachnospiraceae bacterium 54-53]
MKAQLFTQIQQVSDCLLHFGGSDSGKDKNSSQQDLKKGILYRDLGIEEWDWPQGVGLYGLFKVQSYFRDERYMPFFNDWYQGHFKKGLPSRNINTTAPYLPLAELADSLENPSVFRDLCFRQAEWLLNELPKTKEGGFQHVTTAIEDCGGTIQHDSELWIDTLFMAVLFLNKMGRKYNRQDWIDEASRQFLIHIKYLYDKQSGLFYHGWSFNRNDNFGGIYWCRGNSWFTCGIMDYLEDCGSGISQGLRQYLTDTYRAQVNTLIRLQSPSGLWHTVLDDPDSYEEVSGSAAITAGIHKGIRLGILDDSFRPAALNGLKAICRNIDGNGTVQNVSAGTSMGLDADHYKKIVIRPIAYGQSLALLALYEGLENA